MLGTKTYKPHQAKYFRKNALTGKKVSVKGKRALISEGTRWYETRAASWKALAGRFPGAT